MSNYERKEVITISEKDPELNDANDHGEGQEDAYDQLAVESIEYDPAQFEVADDFEVSDDDE